MNEFLLIFRRETRKEDNIPPSPEQIQAMMKPWQDWLAVLSAKDHLVSSGNQLAHEGKVIKPNNLVTNGPYVEIKEAIGGYIIIQAVSIEAAAELSKDCPILSVGGSVEVRQIVPMD
ncbi:MAG: YciI family protein [Saprospiraceae bacterium]|nr:YciI family protein [Saprospiraceae bacterium]